MNAGRTSSGPCSLPWSFGHGDIMRFGKLRHIRQSYDFQRAFQPRFIYVYWTRT
jgi:hypothetical protein